MTNTRVKVMALLFVGAAGCASSPRTGSHAEARDNEQLYEDRCGRCHDPVPAHGYPPAQWPAIVQRMRVEARLTDQEARHILGWLQEGRR